MGNDEFVRISVLGEFVKVVAGTSLGVPTAEYFINLGNVLALRGIQHHVRFVIRELVGRRQRKRGLGRALREDWPIACALALLS